MYHRYVYLYYIIVLSQHAYTYLALLSLLLYYSKNDFPKKKMKRILMNPELVISTWTHVY